MSHSHILFSTALSWAVNLHVLPCRFPESPQAAPGWLFDTDLQLFKTAYQEMHRALAVYRRLIEHFSYCSWGASSKSKLHLWAHLYTHRQNAFHQAGVAQDTHRAFTATLWQRQGMQAYLHFADEKIQILDLNEGPLCPSRMLSGLRWNSARLGCHCCWVGHRQPGSSDLHVLELCPLGNFLSLSKWRIFQQGQHGKRTCLTCFFSSTETDIKDFRLCVRLTREGFCTESPGTFRGKELQPEATSSRMLG